MQPLPTHFTRRRLIASASAGAALIVLPGRAWSAVDTGWRWEGDKALFDCVVIDQAGQRFPYVGSLARSPNGDVIADAGAHIFALDVGRLKDALDRTADEGRAAMTEDPSRDKPAPQPPDELVDQPGVPGYEPPTPQTLTMIKSGRDLRVLTPNGAGVELPLTRARALAAAFA